jgi:hypothetical protein
MPRTIRATLVFVCLTLLLPDGLGGQTCPAPDTIPRSELLQAMRTVGGYSLTRTATMPIFSAQVFLALAKRRAQNGQSSPWFVIPYDDWFESHLQTVGLPAESLPVASRAAYAHQQDAIIYTGPDVVALVHRGAAPVTALDVRFYQVGANATKGFRYHDSTSVPEVSVFMDPEVRYKLLEFPDMLVLDAVDGIAVRPRGFWSMLFAVFGNARVEQSRMALSADYWQVIVGRGRFAGFTATRTAVVEPDGKAHTSVPKERKDLAEIERRLKLPLEIRYRAGSGANSPGSACLP